MRKKVISQFGWQGTQTVYPLQRTDGTSFYGPRLPREIAPVDGIAPCMLCNVKRQFLPEDIHTSRKQNLVLPC